MGKNKKIPNLKVKTSRYFTKTCQNCQYEYPNWFVSCPRCGTAWDENAAQQAQSSASDLQKKNIKIVVKITEEEFGEPIEKVQLIFSADHGKSWYQMGMDTKMDYFIAELADVPVGSVIIYYVEAYLQSGEKVIENNEGKYFYYKVGAPITEIQEEHPPKEDAQAIQENITRQQTSPQEPAQALESPQTKSEEPSTPQEVPEPEEYEPDDDITIFGKPQTRKESDLKICPKCKSKIKKMWSTCPICGNEV